MLGRDCDRPKGENFLNNDVYITPSINVFSKNALVHIVCDIFIKYMINTIIKYLRVNVRWDSTLHEPMISGRCTNHHVGEGWLCGHYMSGLASNYGI